MDPFKPHIPLPFVPTQSHVLAPPAPISPFARLKPQQIPGLWGASNPQICTFFEAVTSAINPTSPNRPATQPDRIRAGNSFQINRIHPSCFRGKGWRGPDAIAQRAPSKSAPAIQGHDTHSPHRLAWWPIRTRRLTGGPGPSDPGNPHFDVISLRQGPPAYGVTSTNRFP